MRLLLFSKRRKKKKEKKEEDSTSETSERVDFGFNSNTNGVKKDMDVDPSLACGFPTRAPMKVSRNPTQPVELGTINYVNLPPPGQHGDYELALSESGKSPNKPLLVNFVEWSGWQGCKDAGRIFMDPAVKRAAEELFVPMAFNTWDRSNSKYNTPFKRWAGNLKTSWWGYVRIIDPRGDGDTVLATTRQITGYQQLEEVKTIMRAALKKMNITVPDYLK